MATSNQNLKRSRNMYDSDSEHDIQSQGTQPFPRFLIVESTDPDKRIATLSPFVIEKQIESIAGVPKSVKKLKTGNLLIEVEKPQHAKNLTKIKEFYHIPCKCFPHGSLNSSKGVIRCRDLAGVSDSEIASELKSQHVTAAKRIKVKRDNKLVDTHTIILTFGISILPRTITVGYLVTKVDIYIPNPLQCFNCFKFGHGSKACRLAGEFARIAVEMEFSTMKKIASTRLNALIAMKNTLQGQENAKFGKKKKKFSRLNIHRILHSQKQGKLSGQGMRHPQHHTLLLQKQSTKPQNLKMHKLNP